MLPDRYLTFSFRTSSGCIVAGFSMATKLRIWSKWFCITSRIMPKLSKYPPRPSVPNGSLKVICTCAMLSLFHPVFNILFPNLKKCITLPTYTLLYANIYKRFLDIYFTWVSWDFEPSLCPGNDQYGTLDLHWTNWPNGQ